MFTIYGDGASGNCLKVKYVAELLGLAFEWVDVDVLSGETRSENFLTLNPSGQVPAIRIDNGQVLAQSNAIMLYLAHGSALIPEGIWDKAKMHEWLFWEQYTHEPAIAVTRFHVVYQNLPLEKRDATLVEKGEKALDRMEDHLRGEDWLVVGRLTLADIALFAYTQFAKEAGFDLDARPNLLAWLGRVRAALRHPVGNPISANG